MRKQILAFLFGALFLFGGSVSMAGAEEATSTNDAVKVTELQAQVEKLLGTINQLQEKIEVLQDENSDKKNKKKANVQIEECELTSVQASVAKDCARIVVLHFTSDLERGMKSPSVRHLQKILATDKAIYPEGLITGFYGQLTEEAVKRFQAKYDIPQAGRVGPRTLAHLNAILRAMNVEEGHVPSELLISPRLDAAKIKMRIRNDDDKKEVRLRVRVDKNDKDNESEEEESDSKSAKHGRGDNPAMKCTRELLSDYDAFFKKYATNDNGANCVWEMCQYACREWRRHQR